MTNFFTGIYKYFRMPRGINENWTRRLPRQFVVGFTGDNNAQAINLLKVTFTDAQLIEQSLENQDNSTLMSESLSLIHDNTDKQLFIQEFPYSFENAKEYETKTNGINLFINFTGSNLAI